MAERTLADAQKELESLKAELNLMKDAKPVDDCIQELLDSIASKDEPLAGAAAADNEWTQAQNSSGCCTIS